MPLCHDDEMKARAIAEGAIRAAYERYRRCQHVASTQKACVPDGLVDAIAVAVVDALLDP